MNREQALLDVQNYMGVIAYDEREEFLDHLLSQFDDPIGWLKNVDDDYFPTILRKHYHKNYKHAKRKSRRSI